MKLSKLSSLLASVVVIAGASMKASAANVYMQFSSVSPGVSVEINTPGSSGYFTTTAGQFNFNVSGQASLNSPDSVDNAVLALIPGPTLKTFCIDVDQGVSTSNPGPIYSILGPGWGAYTTPMANSASLQQLFNKFYADLPNDSLHDAAFQVAIWEIINDTTLSLTAGGFEARTTGSSSSTNAITQANYYLTHLYDAGPLSSWTIYQLHSDTKQDQIFATLNTGTNIVPVPLPAALPSGLALLAGIGALGKFRRKTQTA